MIIPDINLLLYAYHAGSPFHRQAEQWWRECLSNAEPVALVPAVAFGFVRIASNGRVFANPMTPAEATGHVRSWLQRGVVQVLETRTDHVHQVLKLLDDLGTAGNLVTDAQIAAIALEHGAVVHTADAHFLRFPGLRWFNPITGMRSASLPKKQSP